MNIIDLEKLNTDIGSILDRISKTNENKISSFEEKKQSSMNQFDRITQNLEKTLFKAQMNIQNKISELERKFNK